MYHRICEMEKDFVVKQKLVSSSPEIFNKQIEYLKAKYNVISLDNYI